MYDAEKFLRLVKGYFDTINNAFSVQSDERYGMEVSYSMSHHEISVLKERIRELKSGDRVSSSASEELFKKIENLEISLTEEEMKSGKKGWIKRFWN
jgi:hypothetical protein